MIRRALIGVFVCLAANAPAAAQSVELFPRFNFWLSAAHISSDEPRFVWDTNFGGEVDVVDYRYGRATFLANYQAILGEEFKKFDPNQGNYILIGTGSVRARRLEVAGVFYHQSRHLGDRFNQQPVDWNMVGGRVRSVHRIDRVTIEEQVDLLGVIQKSFVDYRWEFDGGLAVRRPMVPGLAMIGGGGLRVIGVDGSRNRGTQYGFQAEGGVRIEGRGAGADLFIAVERRIDPYPLESSTATWFMAGFRLVSRESMP